MNTVSRKKHKSLEQDRGIKITFTVIFAIFSAMILFPFAWILLNSFKNGFDEFSASSWALPKKWMFSNYALIFTFEEFDIVTMFINTIILCLITPTMSLISTVLAAYAMAKYKFIGQKVLYAIYIIPMLVSITGTLTATFLLLEKWGLLYNYGSIIVMSAGGTGFNFLMMYAMFKGISNTYSEAATIDGAGHFRIFAQVILPHVTGLAGTIWILGFIGSWNDYATPKIFLGDDYLTIATGVQKIGELVESTATGNLLNNYPAYFAAVILSLIPVVTLFFIFQKQIMKMSLGGGIK